MPPLEPRHDWDKERLQSQWSLWDEPTRDVYKYWLDGMHEFETGPLQAANFAALKACEFVRRRAWDHYYTTGAGK